MQEGQGGCGSRAQGGNEYPPARRRYRSAAPAGWPCAATILQVFCLSFVPSLLSTTFLLLQSSSSEEVNPSVQSVAGPGTLRDRAAALLAQTSIEVCPAHRFSPCLPLWRPASQCSQRCCGRLQGPAPLVQGRQKP